MEWFLLNKSFVRCDFGGTVVTKFAYTEWIGCYSSLRHVEEQTRRLSTPLLVYCLQSQLKVEQMLL